MRGPVLLVDDHGWVAHHSGIAVRDRIGVPRADRALAVPGMGLCLPERLADGWLVRPPGGGHALTARLDLTSRPVLEVRAEGDPGRSPSAGGTGRSSTCSPVPGRPA